jgi:hypothetical protein
VKPLSAGSEIDAWCTKCKMDLGHRIIAMVENRPKRVICQTCGSQHNYHSPRNEPRGGIVRHSPSGASTSTDKPRVPSQTQRARAEQDRMREWELKVLGKPATVFTRYTIEHTFSAGALLLHKKFGEGFVSEVLEDSKIVVMFREGPRTLVHKGR